MPPDRENWLHTHPDFGALLVLAAGFALRAWTASGTFLNPDEALHYRVANKASLWLAYQASLTTAHPPLFILLLHFWRNVGVSEFILRLPSIIAGTAFCWIFFKWLTRVFGRTIGWVGLIFVSFLPPMVELSSEVRQYALLLFFMVSAAWLLECALQKNSAARMVLSSACLYLAMLTHYSALLFAAALGVYAGMRLVTGAGISPRAGRTADSSSPAAPRNDNERENEPRNDSERENEPRNDNEKEGNTLRIVLAWITGQLGAAGLFVFLYATHISKLKASGAADATIAGWLSKSFYHPGHDNLLVFAVGRTFGVFQYVFGQLAVGVVAGLLFLIAVAILVKAKAPAGDSNSSPRQLGIFLLLPFVLNCGAAIVGGYPYGGTRHSAFLAMFAIAGVSYLLARVRLKSINGVVLALVIVLACRVFGSPHRPYMLREDQSHAQMDHALNLLRRQAPPGSVIFVDPQTSLQFGHYICEQKLTPRDSSVPGFESYSCGGYRIITTSPEVMIFDAGTFLRKWNEMVHAFALKPGDSVWIVQAGWDIHLAHDLQAKFRGSRDLKAESFGRNITMFALRVGDPMLAPIASL